MYLDPARLKQVDAYFGSVTGNPSVPYMHLVEGYVCHKIVDKLYSTVNKVTIT